VRGKESETQERNSEYKIEELSSYAENIARTKRSGHDGDYERGGENDLTCLLDLLCLLCVLREVLQFECIADGNPVPRITWFKNGELIIPSEYFVVNLSVTKRLASNPTVLKIKIASNRLKIFGLVKEDQGVYQCFADNEIGSSQAAAQLLVDSAGESVVCFYRIPVFLSQKYCHGFTP